MMNRRPTGIVRFALPKGHMQQGVLALLEEAGMHVRMGSRNYRPSLPLPNVETKILKPQNIIEMLHVGSRDFGFAGADWVQEIGADVVEVLDTQLDPVRIVAAAPEAILVDGALPKQPLVIASEYERLTRRWIEAENLDATFVRSFGATEVFPPEDADCIVDNSATGGTLKANHLKIVAELAASTTRLYANPKSMENPECRAVIDQMVLLLRSVLAARKRVMLELNVSAEGLERIVSILPCMRKPTISPLFGEDGYAVKAAVHKETLPDLIPALKAAGGSDIVVTAPDQLVP